MPAASEGRPHRSSRHRGSLVQKLRIALQARLAQVEEGAFLLSISEARQELAWTLSSEFPGLQQTGLNQLSLQTARGMSVRLEIVDRRVPALVENYFGPFEAPINPSVVVTTKLTKTVREASALTALISQVAGRVGALRSS